MARATILRSRMYGGAETVYKYHIVEDLDLDFVVNKQRFQKLQCQTA